MIEQAKNPLPVIAIVSDGADNVSRTPLAKLVATRRQSETLVYGIDTVGTPSKIRTPLNPAFAVDVLPELVGDSGGTIYRVPDSDHAEIAALAFITELRSQYTIGFVPRKAPDGRFRTLKVETVEPGLVVRHRAGYLAVPPKS